MNSFLVGHERAFRIERTLAVLDATEESHLTCNAEQCPVLLALMSRKTTLVQKTEATVTILTEMSGFCCTGTLFNSEIKRRRTVISFQVLKREQIAYKTSELTCHDANLQTSRTKQADLLKYEKTGNASSTKHRRTISIVRCCKLKYIRRTTSQHVCITNECFISN